VLENGEKLVRLQEEYITRKQGMSEEARRASHAQGMLDKVMIKRRKGKGRMSEDINLEGSQRLVSEEGTGQETGAKDKGLKSKESDSKEGGEEKDKRRNAKVAQSWQDLVLNLPIGQMKFQFGPLPVRNFGGISHCL
jgi:hypothetical protein